MLINNLSHALKFYHMVSVTVYLVHQYSYLHLVSKKDATNISVMLKK